MNDLILSALGIVCAVLVLLSPVACTMFEDQLIAEAIKNGTSPQAAKCAIGTGTSDRLCENRMPKP